MTNIVLICASGMSTSLMVNKMKAAAQAQGIECNINAYAKADIDKAVAGADIVLLGPQVSFMKAKVQAVASCPVETIEMRAYGQMDGAAVFAAARKTLGI